MTKRGSKEDLSILSTIDIPRRHDPINVTNHTPPRLKLGIVVKDKDGYFMICIQPLCDSVRINHGESTEYPFLMLTTQNVTDKKGLDLCVPPQDGVSPALWLGISPIPKNIITRPFKSKSDSEAYVEGIPSGNSSIFKAENGEELEWIAQIKIGKAQRIVSQLAAKIHTLGIEEFEWMRLHQ